MTNPKFKDVILLILAFVIPLIVITVAYRYTFGHRFINIILGEITIVAAQVVIYAIPFFVFWISRCRSYLLWSIQTVLIISVWAWFLHEVDRSMAEGSGANIGAGLLLIVAPLITGTISFSLSRLLRSRL